MTEKIKKLREVEQELSSETQGEKHEPNPNRRIALAHIKEAILWLEREQSVSKSLGQWGYNDSAFESTYKVVADSTDGS